MRDGGRYVLHGKSLLVVSASDLEYISLELISNRIPSDFLANLHHQSSPLTPFGRVAYSLVHERSQTTLIFDFDQLLSAIGRVSNLRDGLVLLLGERGSRAYIELHPAPWAIMLTAGEVE
jgi:hypothetical protein